MLILECAPSPPLLNRQIWVNVFSLLDHQLYPATDSLTHWGRMTHICVSKLTIIGSDIWYRLAGVKRLSEPMLGYYQLDRSKQTSVNSCIFQWNCICNCRQEIGGHFLGLSVLRICPLRCAVPLRLSGWPLRKRSDMILVEVSQQAFLIMSGSHLFNMFVLSCNVNLV